MIKQTPELWDGGWWYKVPALGDGTSESPLRPDIEATAWCAWYQGQQCLVRVVSPVNVDEYDIQIGIPKPLGRVGGA